MADRDVFKDRGRSLEEEYFRRQERDLIEKMRRRATEDEARQRMGTETGLVDEEILHDLQALGYTPETILLLHLVPLVQMAWAEGDVSERERALILEAARSHGIAPDSDAGRQLAGWLIRRPSDELFDKTLRAIAAMLQARPADARASTRQDLVSYCTAIASASGGILGFRAVSDEERAVLARITQELERAHASVTLEDVLPPNVGG